MTELQNSFDYSKSGTTTPNQKSLFSGFGVTLGGSRVRSSICVGDAREISREDLPSQQKKKSLWPEG